MHRFLSTGFLAASATVMLACRQPGDRENQGVAGASESELRALIAAETGVKVPPTAHVAGFKYRERGAVSAKLILNERDWTTFLETMPVDEEAMVHSLDGLGADWDWWDPSTAKNLRSGQVRREPLEFLNIGIDDTDPNAVLVYINQF